MGDSSFSLTVIPMRCSSTHSIRIAAITGLFTCGAVSGAVVLNQIGTPATYNFGTAPGPSPSQYFTDFPLFDCIVLEDFTVGAAELEISRVSALFQAQAGFMAFLGVEGYQVNFFSNIDLAATSLTGDAGSFRINPGSGATVTEIVDPLGRGEFGLVELNLALTLPAAGTYWVGVSPIAPLATAGQFRLLNGGASGEVLEGAGGSKLANPGQGFGTGPLSPLTLNFAYAVSTIPEPSVPLLSLLAVAWGACRRRRF